MVNRTGHLVLLGQNTSAVWSAKPTKSVRAPILQLLDTGNLVLRDEKDDENSEEGYLWQSFDYPGDTLLPGMKLGWDLRTRFERRLVSWKSPDDPSPGDFDWGITLHTYPESETWKGPKRYFRDGPWNGIRFSGLPELRPNFLFRFDFVTNEDEAYYIFQQKNESIKTRLILNQSSGYIRVRYAWNAVSQSWDTFSRLPRDTCDEYGLCGAFGKCVAWEAPVCQCLKGFSRKGNLLDWSQGCIRNKPFNCQDKDSSGFVKFSGLKLPETANSWVKIAVVVLVVFVAVCGMFWLAYYIRKVKARKVLEASIHKHFVFCKYLTRSETVCHCLDHGGPIFYQIWFNDSANEVLTESKSQREERCRCMRQAFATISGTQFIIQTVVWVANQQNPINDYLRTMMISSTGHLFLLGQKISVVWSASPTQSVQAPILQLLDSGNLVLIDEKDDENSDKYLCSSDKYYWSGPWNGLTYSGAPQLKPNPLFENESAKSRVVLNQTNGYIGRHYAWNSGTQSWHVFASVTNDECDIYALWRLWKLYHWRIPCLKLPDTTYSRVNVPLNLKECKTKCLSNCSSIAYLNTDIREGDSGCAMWSGDLIDIRELQDGGQDPYVRIHASDLAVKVMAVIFVVCGCSCLLIISAKSGTGHLVLLRQKSSVVWSASPTQSVQAPILQLLDTGNLVLRDEKDENSENYLWQSFDYPTDTLLPGMKLGWDLKTGLERRIVSWKSPDDPSPGDFSWRIELHNYPEGQTWKGSKKYYRDGPWNGLRYTGNPELKPNLLFTFEFVNHKDEVYYIFHLKNESVKTRIVVNQTNGYIRERCAWNSETQSWDVFSSMPRDNCDGYGLCGAYGNCVIWEAPVCQCFKGFKPKGNFMDWSQGCVRNKPLTCHDKHSSAFVKISGLKLPDTTYTWVNGSMNLKECKAKCISNCSCTAYTISDISGKGSGCAMWFGDLIDIRELQVGGQDLHVRMHASELGANGEHKLKMVVEVLAVIFVVGGTFLLVHCIRKIRARKGLEGVAPVAAYSSPKKVEFPSTSEITVTLLAPR
ncbi:hypothetical protein FEM48_Zijuj01G0215200 [Ziziphus jujuba var. spinosa]|uniref:Uncharacterized protein n=1 Tax=Ziziphus jujuba var. spinosa TaxID=714518 RepID=A0A978W3N9_ZIZJJ|nr:hypothetical protein FEM48_Zijuj01G0215200 [Ziziphus jujuba var. spinosa]